jgi:hypothetical protein
MRKANYLIFVLSLLTSLSVLSQTVLIDPTGDGGFENGTSFADNGWTVVNGTSSFSDYNRWVVGTDASPTDGTYCAYISCGNSGNYGTSANYAYNYLGNSSSDDCHIYRDINFPAGEDLITLSFEWKCRGYWSDNSDYMRVYLIPTSITPTEDNLLSSTYRIGELYYNHVTTWQSESITIDPSYAGTSYRLVFTWTNSSSGNTQPPAAIDEISLESNAANMTYASSTTTQASTSTLCPGTLNNEIICVQIETADGLSNPLTADSFTFNTGSGTSNTADISNAKLYYTGTNSSFSTTTQVGSTVNTPNGSFTISPSQTMTLGTNYFWLSYDINPSATVGNSVDCECNSITVSSTSYTPTATNPAGVRNIPSGCPPGNDDCSNAWDIPLTGTISGSNYDAQTTIQPDDPNPITEASCNSSSDNVVFFKFTTTTAGDYQVCFSNLSCSNSDGIQASIFDTDQCHTTHNWPSELDCKEPMNTNDFCVSASGLLAGTTYMVTVDGYSGCECSFDIGVQENTLPVELISYELKQSNQNIIIQWVTLSETNCNYYSIYRMNGNKNELLEEIKGAGNAFTEKSYEIIDKKPKLGINYYSLYQTDYDGTTKLLGIKAIKSVNDSFIDVNYSQDYLVIKTNDNSLIERVKIINSLGAKVYEETHYSETVQLNTNRFHQGIYILQISLGNKIYTKKIRL